MISSTVSKESAPRSLVKLAESVISDSSIPNLSTMISFILFSKFSIKINFKYDAKIIFFFDSQTIKLLYFFNKNYLKKLSEKHLKNKEEYYLIGIVSSCKEYKLAWVLENLLDISLKKESNEKIDLIDNKTIELSFLISRDKNKYFKLISNKLLNNPFKSHLIASLSNFDYLIQFSINYFDNSPSDIINTLKSDNLIHFANFVDIKLIKEKYLLYI